MIGWMTPLAANRLRQLLERALVDLRAGLAGVRDEAIDVDSSGRAGPARAFAARVGNQGAQAMAERGSFFCHGCPPATPSRGSAAAARARNSCASATYASAPRDLRVVQDDGHAVAGRLAETDVARNDGRVDFVAEELPHVCRRPAGPGSCGRRTSSAARLRSSSAGLSAARTRSIVPTGSAMPSSAKYSQLRGTSTASAATSALSVSRPSDGGESMKM